MIEAAMTHGSASTYRNHECRCASCTEAHRQRMSERREARRQYLREVGGRWTSTADVEHGSTSTYANWLCRCWPCTHAASASRATYRTAATP